MGRDSFITDSKLCIRTESTQDLLEEFDYYLDEDKAELENLCDCLEDYGLSLREEQDGVAEFYLHDANEDRDFDWEILRMMAPFLEDGSFIEETPPYIEDENGNEIDGVYLGKISNGKLQLGSYTISQSELGKKVYNLAKEYDHMY